MCSTDEAEGSDEEEVYAREEPGSFINMSPSQCLLNQREMQTNDVNNNKSPCGEAGRSAVMSVQGT